MGSPAPAPMHVGRTAPPCSPTGRHGRDGVGEHRCAAAPPAGPGGLSHTAGPGGKPAQAPTGRGEWLRPAPQRRSERARRATAAAPLDRSRAARARSASARRARATWPAAATGGESVGGVSRGRAMICGVVTRLVPDLADELTRAFGQREEPLLTLAPGRDGPDAPLQTAATAGRATCARRAAAGRGGGGRRWPRPRRVPRGRHTASGPAVRPDRRATSTCRCGWSRSTSGYSGRSRARIRRSLTSARLSSIERIRVLVSRSCAPCSANPVRISFCS